MEKITSISQATDYIYHQIKELNPEIEKDDVYDTILDEVMESSEYMLTDDDQRFLEENEDDKNAINEYLQRKIPNFEELLDDIVTDMVSEEIETEE